jgi:hypothetical protein
MCCLGFYARALGYSVDDICERRSPQFLEDPKQISSLVGKKGFDNELCRNLMYTNDNEDIKDDVRERQIARLFEKIDVDVKFS